jgi:5-methylcytosine-specific restriction enzyme subunit McrC
LNGKNPTPEDLRQMYVYHDYFNAAKVALIYPSDKMDIQKGTFVDTQHNDLKNKECSIIPISTESDIGAWQMDIFNTIDAWLKGEKEMLSK